MSDPPARDGIGGSGGSGIAIIRYKIAELEETLKATGGSVSFYNGKTIHVFTSSGTFATNSNWSAATVEYVVIGGGGAGGGNAGAGGGAGAYRTNTTPIGAHPVSTTIQVGAGGRGVQPNNGPPTGVCNGTPSYFGTPITAPGGGHGGLNAGPGGNGGSGGGNPGNSSDGDSFPGTIGATPGNGWGHDGGNGSGSGATRCGGGGGGAGGEGQNASAPATGGDGGAGIQLPSTFRNPEFVNPSANKGFVAAGPTSAPTPNGFDTSGNFWVAGGGGGSSHAPGPDPGGGWWWWT